MPAAVMEADVIWKSDDNNELQASGFVAASAYANHPPPPGLSLLRLSRPPPHPEARAPDYDAWPPGALVESGGRRRWKWVPPEVGGQPVNALGKEEGGEPRKVVRIWHICTIWRSKRTGGCRWDGRESISGIRRKGCGIVNDNNDKKAGRKRVRLDREAVSEKVDAVRPPAMSFSAKRTRLRSSFSRQRRGRPRQRFLPLRMVDTAAFDVWHSRGGVVVGSRRRRPMLYDALEQLEGAKGWNYECIGGKSLESCEEVEVAGYVLAISCQFNFNRLTPHGLGES
ncbi:hypothetical protein BDZ97DRAFT_2066095 [Flammula alnicola]|nr:hypothetical protein BDZ97DRAFT_2066095 [Flammula alnicola]